MFPNIRPSGTCSRSGRSRRSKTTEEGSKSCSSLSDNEEYYYKDAATQSKSAGCTPASHGTPERRVTRETNSREVLLPKFKPFSSSNSKNITTQTDTSDEEIFVDTKAPPNTSGAPADYAAYGDLDGSVLPSYYNIPCYNGDGFTTSIPRINACELRDEEQVGTGGEKGACVYRINASSTSPKSQYTKILMAAQAHKVYKHPIHKNEIDFAETLHEIKEKHRKAISTDTFLDIGFAYLVGPEAVVVHGKDEKGLLMTLYDCSLKQFLERTSASGLRAERGKRGGSAFLTTRRYDCVQSMEVIKAVSFQLLCAIAAMNERMSHCSNNKTFKGFVHNDLHLENILLLYNGNIALCDFELVSHTPGDPATTVKNTFSRLPPPSRQSPRGMYTDSADTWGFALIVINLLTGVDPLFDNDVITDDFGNGPLLMGHDDPSVPQNAKVLDWEENIGKYVEELLLQLDPTGERKREASQLLTLCSRCLVNRKGATPSLASDLLRMDMFNTYRDSPVLASEVIQRWVEQQKKLEKQQK